MSNALFLEEIHGHRIIIEFGCIMLHAFNVLHGSNGMSLARSWIPIDLTGENVARYFGVPIECSSQDKCECEGSETRSNRYRVQKSNFVWCHISACSSSLNSFLSRAFEVASYIG